MNLDNIIEFLKLLGIKMTVDNNRMLFYDSETNERIESYYNTTPLPFYANDVKTLLRVCRYRRHLADQKRPHVWYTLIGLNKNH